MINLKLNSCRTSCVKHNRVFNPEKESCVPTEDDDDYGCGHILQNHNSNSNTGSNSNSESNSHSNSKPCGLNDTNPDGSGNSDTYNLSSLKMHKGVTRL
jgi:hypothetical protein